MRVDIASLDNLIKGVIACHKSKVINQVFDKLHAKVCDAEDTPWKDTLIENHAHKRRDLNEKADALDRIIAGWDNLIKLTPARETMATNKKRSSPSPQPTAMAPGQNSPARKSPRRN